MSGYIWRLGDTPRGMYSLTVDIPNQQNYMAAVLKFSLRSEWNGDVVREITLPLWWIFEALERTRILSEKVEGLLSRLPTKKRRKKC